MSWDVKVAPLDMDVEPFEGNVTYNVGNMLRRAGIHPAILSGMTAKQAQPVIENAYMLMWQNPDYFRQFDASNGWGTYETTFDFVTKLNTYLINDAPDDYIIWWN